MFARRFFGANYSCGELFSQDYARRARRELPDEKYTPRAFQNTQELLNRANTLEVTARQSRELVLENDP